MHSCGAAQGSGIGNTETVEWLPMCRPSACLSESSRPAEPAGSLLRSAVLLLKLRRVLVVPGGCV